MENIFIVLAIVGSVIYKIYTNYREEMEKAAKRRQQVPPVPNPVQTKQHVPAPAAPSPTVAPVLPPTRTAQPYAQHIDELPSEVKSVQQARLERAHKRSQPVEDKRPATETFRFDLRQAVIQSAILDRPYK